MVTGKSEAPRVVAGDHVRVRWVGLDAEGVVVDVYSSVVGVQVVVDIIWSDDSQAVEPTRIAVPADKVTTLSAA